MPTKTIFFYFLQLIALLNAVLFVGLNYESNTHYLIIISYAVFMLIAVLSVRYAPKYFFGIPLLVLLINSFSIRLIMTEFQFSDDVYRYTWEGHIQNHGYNPYTIAPDNEEIKHLVWKGYEVPNHANLTTIYPPLSLYFFRLVSLVTLDYSIYQYLFLALDILVIGLILYLLNLRGDPLENIIYYALNPVCIVAFSAQAHLDILMLLWLVLGIIFYYRQFWLAMWVCLSLAVLSKLLVLLLVPCFINYKNWSSFSSFLVVLLFGYAPFLSDGVHIFETFFIFGTKFEYNSSLFGVLNFLIQNQILSLIILFICSALICCWSIVFFDDALLAGIIVVSCFLLCAPTVHYWYLSLLVPFLCFHRRNSLLLWCATSGAWFAVLQSIHFGDFQHFPYYQILQYGPVYLLLIKEIYDLNFRALTLDNKKSPQDLSILIPILNEEQNLKKLLPQLKSQMSKNDEIIIVDGGSTDQSVNVALNSMVRVVNSPRGRGYQITKGMRFASNPVVLILHADQQLENNILRRVGQAMNNEEINGGCIGSVFESLDRGQWIIHILNVIRARIMKISFGDQGQFFRRSLWKREQWSLDMPLMEDVELSILLNNLTGRVCYLGGGLISSVRRWQEKNRVLNAIEIIKFVLTYCLLRRFTKEVDTWSMYKRYYG
tara:strand:+ start:397 stop:2370 length:1974 start_codon:yes stop_codon:yes gene_type:complete